MRNKSGLSLIELMRPGYFPATHNLVSIAASLPPPHLLLAERPLLANGEQLRRWPLEGSDPHPRRMSKGTSDSLQEAARHTFGMQGRMRECRRGTWWDRARGHVVEEGKDFVQDTQDGGYDHNLLAPEQHLLAPVE
jgi:hypothetical protein